MSEEDSNLSFVDISSGVDAVGFRNNASPLEIDGVENRIVELLRLPGDSGLGLIGEVMGAAKLHKISSMVYGTVLVATESRNCDVQFFLDDDRLACAIVSDKHSVVARETVEPDLWVAEVCGRYWHLVARITNELELAPRSCRASFWSGLPEFRHDPMSVLTGLLRYTCVWTNGKHAYSASVAREKKGVDLVIKVSGAVVG